MQLRLQQDGGLLCLGLLAVSHWIMARLIVNRGLLPGSSGLPSLLLFWCLSSFSIAAAAVVEQEVGDNVKLLDRPLLLQ